MARVLRVGTRKSALAKWQAEMVADLISSQSGAPKVKFVYFTTEGDRLTEHPLHALPGRSFFTKDIERALLDEKIDLAVHSLKDLATVFPAGLELGAVLQREDPRDVVVARDDLRLDSAPAGTRVGTSSLRRRAFLAQWRPELEVVDIRGNVPTRVKLVDSGKVDCVVMAAAGLKRLGLADRITEYLPVERILPAAGQGAVAVQLRSVDHATLEWVSSLDHAPTRQTTEAERGFLNRLEGGCQLPVGAIAHIENEALTIVGGVASLDGKTVVKGQSTGPITDAAALGRELAEDVLKRGGEAILKVVRSALERR